jgi:DNA-3-methyladenine glycosylase I
MTEKIRCEWCSKDPLYMQYHDEEWGVPVYDDQKLFEMLCLEGAQAGLSWITVLRKRESYRKVFDAFDAKKMARYTDAKKAKLLQNEGIIRNKLKVEAFIKNAQAYLQVQKELGSFSSYIWSFTGGKPIANNPLSLKEVPAKTPLSDAISKDLAKRGFKFVGSTICYAFMQACGLVDDHVAHCWKKTATRSKKRNDIIVY